jgi:hypothetical protein
VDQPLLNLDTLIVRPSIAIDGALYELFSPDELSVLASQRFSIWGQRIERLVQSGSDDAETLGDLDNLYATVARAAIVDVPADVFAKLSGAHHMAIVDVFTGLLLRNKLGVGGAMATAMGLEMASQSTGAWSSPGSSASSGAIPDGGWIKRLGRWFGLI